MGVIKFTILRQMILDELTGLTVITRGRIALPGRKMRSRSLRNCKETGGLRDVGGTAIVSASGHVGGAVSPKSSTSVMSIPSRVQWAQFQLGF